MLPNAGEKGSLPPPGAGELWAGKFRVLGELGSGAMAKVLRGYDTKLRREVALKVTRLPRSELPRDELARFAEEAQITAQLDHAKWELDQTTIVAPGDGFVSTLTLTVGDRALPRRNDP